jgi:hypothetical protein
MRTVMVDDRKIEVYDDVFNISERTDLYNFAVDSRYSVDRFGSSLPETSQFHKTMKCTISFPDFNRFKFFSNKFILNYIKDNNLRLKDAYINLSSASDIYQYHVDSFTKGCPTMLYYMNLMWEPEWEGETHFADDDYDIIFSSAFKPGRLVAFDGTIPHKSSQPGPLAKFYRFALAVKYSTPDDPSWNTSISVEDFVYSKTINLDADEQKALQYAQNNTAGIPHSNTDFYEHLYNTYCILKSFGCDKEVCLAGLFHSIYGTEYFNARLTNNENQVIELIGDRANALVKMFSQGNREINIMTNAFNLSTEDDLALTQIHYANLIEQSARIPVGDYSYFASIKNKIDSLKEKL